MLALTIKDVQQPALVEKMDRAELIALVRKHESMHSQWELRVRKCEEKEQLWKNLMQEMGALLGNTFKSCHEAIQEQALQAAELADRMRVIAQNVEDQ